MRLYLIALRIETKEKQRAVQIEKAPLRKPQIPIG